MQISKRIYLRSEGTMTFWRLGRIGGSFYYSRKRDSAAHNAAKRIAHYRNMTRLRAAQHAADRLQQRCRAAYGLLTRAMIAE